MKPTTFIISRTDAIGDTVLTLPVAGVLKSLYPKSKIFFLGRSYTEDVIKACTHIDHFLDWNELEHLPPDKAIRKLKETGADTIIHVFPNRAIAKLAKAAGIRRRIGTTNRSWHWLYCNVLVRLSRRYSPWHEAQLNLFLLRPLGARQLYSLEEIGKYYGLTKLSPLPDPISQTLDPNKFNLILHPKSKGSAREWGLDNFIRLIGSLPPDKFAIFITGTAAEGSLLQPLFDKCPQVTNLTGRLTLAQLMTFIAKADALVAASTGPLHLAAALGTYALGIYPPMRPIHPGRWAPIGEKTAVFVKDKNCSDCRKTKDCHCIREIGPAQIKECLLSINILL
jgi:heptosyltransferase-3